MYLYAPHTNTYIFREPPHGFLPKSFGQPIGGAYSDGCHTRIVYGLDQIISASVDRVVPIAVMKINVG